MKKLSIITINKNNAAGLEKTLASVARQSAAAKTEIEHLVIDGASTDLSAEVIKKYAMNLTTAISEPDSGIYDAMNKGIARATGEYLLFLNSGDFLADEKVIADVLPELRGEKLIFGKMQLCNGKWAKQLPRYEKLSLFTILDRPPPHGASFIARDLFVLMGGYDHTYQIIADWIFFYEAIVDHQIPYRLFDRAITIFDLTGISSTSGDRIQQEKTRYLTAKLPLLLRREYEFYNCSGFRWLKDKYPDFWRGFGNRFYRKLRHKLARLFG